MKTAVSIPNKLYREAERASRRLRVSRSRLYAQAVESFLRSARSQGVREALDAVYEKEESRLDRVLAAMQGLSLDREDW